MRRPTATWLGWAVLGLSLGGCSIEGTRQRGDECLQDRECVSPLRGRPVAVQGTLIGRADAGSYISEDMMMEDPQGGLMTLNYEHWLPLFGNAWFGWKTVSRLVGQPFQATGWFRRGVGQQIDLDELRTQGEGVSSYTAFWGRAGGVVVSLLGLVIMAGALLAASGIDAPSTPPSDGPAPVVAPAPELAPTGNK